MQSAGAAAILFVAAAAVPRRRRHCCCHHGRRQPLTTRHRAPQMLRAMAESELVEHNLKLTAIDERDPYRIVSFEVRATFLNN